MQALTGLHDSEAARGRLQAQPSSRAPPEEAARGTPTPALIPVPAQSRGMREGSQRRWAKLQACWTTSSDGMMPRCTVSSS